MEMKTIAEVDALLGKSRRVGTEFTRVERVILYPPDVVLGVLRWAAQCENGSVYARGIITGQIEEPLRGWLQGGRRVSVWR